MSTVTPEIRVRIEVAEHYRAYRRRFADPELAIQEVRNLYGCCAASELLAGRFDVAEACAHRYAVAQDWLLNQAPRLKERRVTHQLHRLEQLGVLS